MLVTTVFRTPDSFFTIDWQDNGTAGIKGPDGKYLSNKQTGILYSTGSNFEDINKFKIIIVNRSVLVLKCDFGFVGLKGNQYICNKSKYDVLHVASAGDGTYTIQGMSVLLKFGQIITACNVNHL